MGRKKGNSEWIQIKTGRRKEGGKIGRGCGRKNNERRRKCKGEKKGEGSSSSSRKKKKKKRKKKRCEIL